jgi:hypothetical protein
VNREKFEARLHAMGLQADQVYLILVLADGYAAGEIERCLRPPMQVQRRGLAGHGDARREWQDSLDGGPAS